jgi:hypothetical protein
MVDGHVFCKILFRHLSCGTEEIHEKTFIYVLAEIRTENVWNASLEGYRNVSSLGED